MNQKKSLWSVFKRNVVYGLLALFPATIIFLLLSKIMEILEKAATVLNLDSTTGFVLTILVGLLLLLILCFILGTFVRTRIGSWSLEKLERKVLCQIPGYEIISNVLKGFAEKKIAYPAAKIQLYGKGSAVIGFIMEENLDGSLTVFVPSSPALTLGSLHLVDRERVTILKAGSMEVANCISQWGIGSKNLLAERIAEKEGNEETIDER